MHKYYNLVPESGKRNVLLYGQNLRGVIIMIKRKKSIVALLTVALSLSIMVVASKTVYASEYSSVSVDWNNIQDSKQATDSNGVSWKYYKYNDGTICLNGTYDLTSVMEIPSELDGCTVTGIDQLLGYENAILYKESIIGKPVNKVIIPSGVKLIGSSAFGRCANLTEIQIPESINLMSCAAFNKTWLEANRDSNGFVVVHGILIDGHEASGDVTIPSNIRCIADGAFSSSDKITSVTISSSVKRIGERAFSRCPNLTKAIIAEGVEVVAQGAFTECHKLTEAKLPQSVEELGNDVFQNDDALKSTTSSSDGLTISNGVLLSAKYAKGDVSIPSNVTKIQEEAFYYNKNVTSIKIPSSVTEIGERTFQGSSIQMVNIPASVKEIPRSAFENCTNLYSVTIENGVETIGNGAFSECNISKINIPDSVTNIDSLAFANCTKLDEINFKAGTALGANVFLGTPWLDKQSKTGDFTILNGVLLKCDSNASGEVVIPDGVNEIGGSAFSRDMNITSIKIPEGVTRIGEFAFSECRSLSKIYIPSSLNKIEYGAFDFCNNVSFTGPGAQFAQNMIDSKYGIYSANNSNNQSS